MHTCVYMYICKLTHINIYTRSHAHSFLCQVPSSLVISAATATLQHINWLHVYTLVSTIITFIAHTHRYCKRQNSPRFFARCDAAHCTTLQHAATPFAECNHTRGFHRKRSRVPGLFAGYDCVRLTSTSPPHSPPFHLPTPPPRILSTSPHGM